jgi:subtilisin family serine protease
MTLSSSPARPLVPFARLPLAAAALALAGACADPNTAPRAADPTDAPLLARDAAGDPGQPIPDQYIVVFQDGVQDVETKARGKARGGAVRHVYQSALKGFAARLDPGTVAALRTDPDVAYIEQDQVVTVNATQTGATWGLDRIDQRPLPLNSSYSYTNTGVGVTAYIIDTGIDTGHQEFTGRIASRSFDAFTDGQSDCNGHGTHVAGTVGGTKYGVAKEVTLARVRVLNCEGSGTNSGVIAGVDWVTANHVKPAVANMSLGGGASTALDGAVRNSIAAGVTYAIAAGNGNFLGIAQDACKSSPARVNEAITIGATDKNDAKTSWSNYGKCVDFFAPGAGITSAWIGGGNSETNTISGTSMATPHVAGVAALYLQSNAGASPAAVRDALYAATTKGVVTSARSANNHLLFTAY